MTTLWQQSEHSTACDKLLRAARGAPWLAATLTAGSLPGATAGRPGPALRTRRPSPSTAAGQAAPAARGCPQTRSEAA